MLPSYSTLPPYYRGLVEELSHCEDFRKALPNIVKLLKYKICAELVYVSGKELEASISLRRYYELHKRKGQLSNEEKKEKLRLKEFILNFFENENNFLDY